jgi:hypothetical protein
LPGIRFKLQMPSYFRQTCQQQMARVQPGELGLEPLSSARHTQEGKVQKPEQYSLALSANTREYKPPLEQHSLAWPCSIWQPERHTMVSSSKG